jgi:hypothetical protein
VDCGYCETQVELTTNVKAGLRATVWSHRAMRVIAILVVGLSAYVVGLLLLDGVMNVAPEESVVLGTLCRSACSPLTVWRGHGAAQRRNERSPSG